MFGTVPNKNKDSQKIELYQLEFCMWLHENFDELVAALNQENERKYLTRLSYRPTSRLL